MKLLLAAFLLVVTLTPPAEATPPVCMVLDLGEEGGKLGGEIRITCGPRATVTTCPKDGFCTTVSTGDLLP